MKFLLDTNVLSEIRKPNGHAGVKAFIGSLREDDLFISVISIGEINFGIEKLPPGAKKTELLYWLMQKLPERFGKRIITLDAAVMAEWGKLQAGTEKTLPVCDSRRGVHTPPFKALKKGMYPESITLREQHTPSLQGGVVDSLIAASALVHRLALVTRNTKDFERITDLHLVNPWDDTRYIHKKKRI